jgi:hypothetical protein
VLFDRAYEIAGALEENPDTIVSTMVGMIAVEPRSFSAPPYPASASNDSCCFADSPIRSVSRVG